MKSTPSIFKTDLKQACVCGKSKGKLRIYSILLSRAIMGICLIIGGFLIVAVSGGAATLIAMAWAPILLVLGFLFVYITRIKAYLSDGHTLKCATRYAFLSYFEKQ
jgi:hypothetical protein